MTICTVTATFEPIPEFKEEIKSFLIEEAKAVRQEEGCEYYDLYESVTGQLVFIEAWKTRELWQIHNQAPTVARINEFVAGKLLGPVMVQELYSAT